MPAKKRPASPQTNTSSSDFARQADQRQKSLLGELLSMVMQNKKWWMIPILVTVLGLALIVILGGSAAAPFIYTLF